MNAIPRGLLILSPHDNVGILVVEGGSVKVGHKIALRGIAKDSPVMKFGHVIGLATRDIKAGDHVHVHNVCMPPPELARQGEGIPAQAFRQWTDMPSTFMGYRRPTGGAGIRNYLLVVSSVNCSATVVKAVCRHFLSKDLSISGIDGIIPICHAAGCTQSIGGEYHQVLNRTLAGWIFHPNVVGAVVVGLGCEGTTFKSILQAKKVMRLDSDIPLETLNIQDNGGTAQTIQEAIKRVEKVLASLPPLKREELSVSHLGLALNCGGSDAFSSLTANPALGLASDMLVSKGGMVALAEIPECHGAEDLLYRRAASDQVKRRLDQVFSWWHDYATRLKVTLNDNLAPGNIEGGITTIIEKSLGALAKAGYSPLMEVVDYSERITQRGFTLMNTPGFDPVSVTGLVAGGCQLVAFTTGRGSVYGCSIAPTIKIATRSELFESMRGDMDIDAGKALATGSIDHVAADIYRFAVQVANGTKTCSEALGLGWEEFAPWPIGETL